MTDRLDLPSRYRKELEALLYEHVPDVEVWAYGSRVNGRSHEGSDLDLVLRSPTLEPIGYEYVELVKALERSNIPILVQAHDWAKLPESFHREIERNRVVVQDRTKQIADGSAPRDWLYHPNFNSRWKRVSLHALAQWVNGLAFRNIQFGQVGKPVIKIAEIKGGISGQTKFTQQTFDDSVHVSAGDLLFAWSGQPESSIDAYRWNGPAGWLNQHIFRVTPCGEVDDQFFYYLLKYLRPNFIAIARNKQTTGLGHVTRQDLDNLEVGIPPLPDQRAIAGVLGALDAKIELNRRMNETLEQMARAIFQDWFVDFGPVRAKVEGREPYLPAELWDLFPDRLTDSELGEIPEGWEVKALEQVVGLNPREPIKKGTIRPYIDMATLPTSGSSPGDWILREFTSGTRFRNRDVLFARITPCLENGKTALIQSLPEDTVGWGSTEFIVMRAIPPVPAEYPYLLSRDEGFREYAIQSMTGTSGRQRVQVDALASYLVPLPPEEVWTEFNALVSPVFANIEVNRKESRALSAQRDALLPKLVDGQLQVADPNQPRYDQARRNKCHGD